MGTDSAGVSVVVGMASTVVTSSASRGVQKCIVDVREIERI